ncbi:adenosylcobinamide amidohydrolase [Bacillus massilinigeriensis]|uniref:adenosylcobinamide amidohydrolase n=1 Tax=Bacillus massilionigeriensis TaxID=1805475 RepID=UPI00096B67F7|nr:adenosylcobinamide amidohydrolase [Bacillus massilionigeriensis]
MLTVEGLSGGYQNESILKDISFKVGKGEFFGILGPNGSGKTTLLKMLSGILPFNEGNISINGKLLHHYSPKQLAKWIAVLPQHSSLNFAYTVKEAVSVGRYAHQKGWFQAWSKEDEEVVQRVMTQTGVSSFQDKNILELSGGERQRVFLAQALAQEPEILLLDEPTNHLDLSFQKELLDHLKIWTLERGLTVISIFHDLNLAALYCDRILLLENGSIEIEHKPNKVLKEERIKKIYRAMIQKIPHPKIAAPQIVLLPVQDKSDEGKVIINEKMLYSTEEQIQLSSPISLKCMSSGVVGSGFGWFHSFVNRHVDKDYNCRNHREEMEQFLRERGFDPADTVGMMTAVMLEDVIYKMYEGENFSVFIVVTAGVGNAVDASKAMVHSLAYVPGTINTWIFVNGELTDEAYIQGIMTATESKVKALHDLQVTDPITGTIATGTSTDSILIASTQKGEMISYAGTITPFGSLVGKGIYECTTEAIKKSRQRKKG